MRKHDQQIPEHLEDYIINPDRMPLEQKIMGFVSVGLLISILIWLTIQLQNGHFLVV